MAGVVLVVLLAWNFSRSDDSGRVQYWDSELPARQSMSVSAAVTRASDKLGFPVRVPRDVPTGFTLDVVSAGVGNDDLVRLGIDARAATLYFVHENGHALQIDQLPPGGLQPSVAATPLGPPIAGVEVRLEQPGIRGVVTITWVASDAAYLARYITAGEEPPDNAPELLLTVLRSMH